MCRGSQGEPNAVGEQPAEILSHEGHAEEITLTDPASLAQQEVALHLGFNALSDEADIHASRQGYDRSDYQGVSRFQNQLSDEDLVNLELVDREIPKIAEGSVPTAEVVDRDRESQSPQGMKRFHDVRRRLDEQPFGQFDFEIRCAGAEYGQRFRYEVDEPRLDELIA
jgi:hypothetical protein